MGWNSGRPNFPTGFCGNSAISTPSRSMMKPARPLSKSASASQVNATAPWSARALRSTGAGGGEVSLVAPVLIYSAHRRATDAFGSHTASLALPENFVAGFGSSPAPLIRGASQACFAGIGLSGAPGRFGNRSARHASNQGMARYRESPHSWLVRGSGANPIGAPFRRYASNIARQSLHKLPKRGSSFSFTPGLSIAGMS
jgi:hypothetical protein